jgi:chromosome segregation ATPase
MIRQRVSHISLLVFVAFLVACGAAVSQEEHDQVVADLANAEAQIGELESEVSAAESEAAVAQAEIESLQAELDSANAQIAELESEIAPMQERFAELEGELEAAQSELDSLQSEVDAANTDADDAEQQYSELSGRIDRAAAAAELLTGLMELGQSADTVSDADAASIFLSLATQVQEIGDEVLDEKFNALIMTEGGEAESLDLIFYLFDIIGELKTE